MPSQDTLLSISLGLAVFAASPIALFEIPIGKRVSIRNHLLLIWLPCAPAVVISLASFLFALFFPLEPSRSLLAVAVVLTLIGFASFAWNVSRIVPKSEDK